MLANRKEFNAAGYRPEDTGVATVWARPLTNDPENPDCVIIYSEVRSELEDARPQDQWEPCAYYRFDGTEITQQGHAQSPLEAIQAAAAIHA